MTTARQADLIPREDARISTLPPGARDRASDWGSLIADLSAEPDREPSWRIHDRTHLEFAVDYRVRDDAPTTEWEWEAYFFIPQSLRIDGGTYGKGQVYEDLRSYVRFAVPDAAFGDLCHGPIDRLRRSVEGDEGQPIREMRLFACQVRAAAVRGRRRIAAALEGGDPDERATAFASAARLAADAGRVGAAFREATLPLAGESEVGVARDWVDEDISRLLETILGSLAERLRKHRAPKTLIASVREAAVAEARYRDAHGLDGVGRRGLSKRDVEHLEFRRHVLKRFTSSVLWLAPEIRDGTRWALQVLYALAAGVAMAFALAAAILNGTDIDRERVWMWAAIVILAYMGKDRIKASLQSVFAKLVEHRLPDRRWRIRDRERSVVLGTMDEQCAFVPFGELDEDVLAVRRATRRHALEEQARPEKVLWHRKVVRLRDEALDRADDRFDALTEIFRLDLRRWLAHTDDPKRKIVFADPEAGAVLSAVAPRVYNLGIVYRLREKGRRDAPWHRIRVVVSRKGLRRIDHIA